MSLSSRLLEKTAEIQRSLDELNQMIVEKDFKPPQAEPKKEQPQPMKSVPPVEKAPPIKSEINVDWGQLDYLEYGMKVKPKKYLEPDVFSAFNKEFVANGYRYSKEDHAWLFQGEAEGQPQKAAASTQAKGSKVIRISEIGSRKSATIEGELTDDPTYKDFNRKDGTVGSVASFNINDGSGQARVSMWDDKANYTMSFVKGDRVRITSLMVKEPYKGTIQLSGGKFTEITKL